LPTFHWLPPVRADFVRLSPEQQPTFLAAVAQFVEDLRAGGEFGRCLRVKGVQGAPGVFEMTWAPDGRATFEYGEEIKPGESRVVWRRLGTHDIFRQP
jgi:hypothetical protein